MIQELGTYTSLLPIIAFLLFCIKEKNQPLWVIFSYLIVSVGVDIFTAGDRWGRSHQLLIWNIFSFVEFGMLMTFFYLILRSPQIKKGFYIVIFLYIIFAIIVSGKNGEEFNSALSAANSLVFLIFSILYFTKQLNSTDSEKGIPLPIFWVVVGIMLSVACTFFLYLIANKLTEAQMARYWTLNAVSNILTNVIFSIAFILNRFQKKVPAPESHTPDYNGFPN